MAVDHEALLAMLTRLKLTGIRDQLDSLLDEAAREDLTLREALAFLCSREVARKDDPSTCVRSRCLLACGSPRGLDRRSGKAAQAVGRGGFDPARGTIRHCRRRRCRLRGGSHAASRRLRR
jgi:hypothetical protein